VQIGDSIATSGVCLTVTELPGDGFWADVSLETLSLTTLGGLQQGSRVNLEKSLTPQSRLGGHIVSGHVDGIGEIVSLARTVGPGGSWCARRTALAKYIAHKGSICIDGTSLTVNAVDGACFDLMIIPQTMAETVFGDYRPGSRVNLEVDVIARYLERLLQGDAAAKPGRQYRAWTLAATVTWGPRMNAAHSTASASSSTTSATGAWWCILDERDGQRNEGVVMVAAEHCEPEHVTLMARRARGLVCLALTRKRCEELDLPPMVDGRTTTAPVHPVDRGRAGYRYGHLRRGSRAHGAGRRSPAGTPGYRAARAHISPRRGARGRADFAPDTRRRRGLRPHRRPDFRRR
jgi:riboflavin synthase